MSKRRLVVVPNPVTLIKVSPGFEKKCLSADGSPRIRLEIADEGGRI